MAALAGVNTTTVAETIPTESINGLLIPSAQQVRVYEQITWVAKATGTKHVWVQWDPVTVTGTQTESDEVSATNIGTAKEEVTPGMVVLRAFRSDQTDLEGSSASLEAQVAKMASDVANRVDKDVLSLFTGATSSDFSNVNLGLDNWGAALALFYAQFPSNPRIVFVGSVNQYRDLLKAIRDSGNGGMIAGAGLAMYNNMPLMGMPVMFQGIEILQGNVTEADASNDHGGFVSCAPMGSSAGSDLLPGSGVGLALWQPMQAELERIAARRGNDVVISTYYGASITADNNIRGVISKKAAA